MRLVLACQACRARKSKCEGQKPVCGPCLSANRECVYNARADQRKPYSKAFVNSLQERVKTLEAELQASQASSSKRQLDSPLQPTSSVFDEWDTHSLQGRQPLIITSNADAETANDSAASSVADSDFVDELVQRRGLVMRHNDNNLIEGTYRFFGASSGRSMLAARCKLPFQYARLQSLSEKRLKTMDMQRCEPDSDDCRVLFDAYFQHANPILLVLEKDIFYRHLALRSSEQPQSAYHVSELLLNAVGAVGCCFIKDPLEENHGTARSSSSQLRKAYLERVRVLIDVEIEYPQLTTIQALILAGYCEAACGFESRSWLYIGMAARISYELGIHCDSHEYVKIGWMTPEDLRARHRTIWSLFHIDKLMSMYYGRKPSLDQKDISTMAPRPTYDDMEQLPTLEDEYDHHFVAFFELGQFSSAIFAALYDLSNPQESSIQQLWTTWASGMSHKLAEWHSALPRQMKCTFTRGKVPRVATIQVHLIYHSLVILLHRPFLAIGPATGYAEAVFSARACHTSSRQITRLITFFQMHHGIHLTHNFAVHIVYTAITISLLNARASKDTIKREARNDLSSLVQILASLGSQHQNALPVLRIVKELVVKRFQDEKEWAESVCNLPEIRIQDVVESHSNAVTPQSPRTESSSTSLQPLSAQSNAIAMDEDDLLSQYALIQWDSYTTVGFADSLLGENIIGDIDISSWV